MGERLRISIGSAMSMAVELHKRNELDEAQILYNDILKVLPEYPDALHFLGVVKHQQGNNEEGLALIGRSLELVPDSPDALNNLGNMNREMGRLEDAESAYLKVLEIVPDHADALVNLGNIYRELKQPEEALEIIRKALEIEPQHVQAYHNLGNVYRDLKEYDAALAAYEKSEALAPDDSDSRVLIARLLKLADRTDDAIGVLKLQIEQYPDDVEAIHMLAAYSGQDIPMRAPDDYIRRTFDRFSTSFDEVLKRLEYRAPHLVAERVIRELGDSGQSYRMLDIGCGTGLCGPLVKPVLDSLTGVDLSPEMLKRAQRRGVYDQLREAELTAYMMAKPEAFDVVICVDTFVYFGSLDEAFKAICQTLRPGGWAFFTLEQHHCDECSDNFRLQFHGRYSHSKKYLARTVKSAGLVVNAMDDVILRQEDCKPVNGTLVVVRKP